MIIGIDLGTTNCACAVFRGEGVEIIPNSLGQALTPSAVSVDASGEILTGLEARERQSTHPHHTITAFKRYMGTDRRFTLGKHQFGPEDLSALMLRRLKADAEAYLGEMIEEAVITVPAYFNDKQRKATRRAGQLAGLKIDRLINEPTAAALAYSLHQRDKQTRFLVFDLGGGTFDVSILEIFEGVIEVRASAGDNRLGGEDFNDVLIGMARRKIGADIRANDYDDEALFQRLREAAERARRTLSETPSAKFSFIWKNKPFETIILAEEFDSACEELLKRLKEPVLRAIRDGGLSLETLDEIILVGGATRMPLIRKTVTKMFGRFPQTSVDPDEAVARGAAVQAALKARHAALSEVVLTDVCPFSLGVASVESLGAGRFVEGVFTPILERNVVIPASREKSFSTVQDFQNSITFPIYQGESRWVRDNIHLADLSVPVPRARAGEVVVECRFSYDINGILEVDAHVPATKERRQLVIADRDSMTPAQLEERRAELAKLKVHPRDMDQIRATLARAGRCYENAIGEEREIIGRWIGQFEAVLERQDPKACEAAREALNRALDQVDGPAFL